MKRLLLFFSSLFLLDAASAQYELQEEHLFETLSSIQLYDVPGEGRMWGGFGPNTGKFYLIDKEFNRRATFITQFDPEEDNSYQFQVVKYMEDDSDSLYLAHHFFDDSAWENVFHLSNTDGDILQWSNGLSHFFWGEIEPRKGQLILHRYGENFFHSMICYQGELGEVELLHDVNALHFKETMNGLRYFYFDEAENLVTCDSDFNVLSVQDMGMEGLYIKWVGTTQHYFDEDDHFEFLMETTWREEVDFFEFVYHHETRVINDTGENLFAGNNHNYSFHHLEGFPDKFVFSTGDDRRWYSLPGLEEEQGSFLRFYTRMALSADEYVYVEKNYGITSDTIEVSLYRRNESEINYWRDVVVPLEEDVFSPFLTSVSQTFFDKDEGLEYICTFYRQAEDGTFEQKQIFMEEDGTVFFESDLRNSTLFFGECQEDNFLLLDDKSNPANKRGILYRISGINDFLISDFAQGEKVKFFPNPTTGSMDLKWDDESTVIANLEVFDATGRIISEWVDFHCTSNVAYTDLSRLAAGNYYIHVFAANGEREMVKVLKR